MSNMEAVPVVGVVPLSLDILFEDPLLISATGGRGIISTHNRRLQRVIEEEDDTQRFRRGRAVLK